jgi:ubiquinone/menaquinone biosynthesis C-methylase UbiE
LTTLAEGWLPEPLVLHDGARVLEVPCGRGTWILAVARRWSGLLAVGVDLIPANLANGRREAADQGLDVTFVLGRSPDLPFADHTFDVVLSSGSLQRCRDVHETLVDLTRLLTTCGRAVLVLAAGEDGSIREPRHREVTLGDLEGWCRDLGLQVSDRGAGWANIGR